MRLLHVFFVIALILSTAGCKKDSDAGGDIPSDAIDDSSKIELTGVPQEC